MMNDLAFWTRFSAPTAQWTSFEVALRRAELACLGRPGDNFLIFYCPVFGSCASASADPGHKIANAQMPGLLFWVVLGRGKSPRLLRGVPACGNPRMHACAVFGELWCLCAFAKYSLPQNGPSHLATARHNPKIFWPLKRQCCSGGHKTKKS